jgi:hypothetical protein
MDWSIVTDWLVSHGERILIIIVISFALYFVLQRLLPRALRLIELQAVTKADRAGIPLHHLQAFLPAQVFGGTYRRSAAGRH